MWHVTIGMGVFFFSVCAVGYEELFRLYEEKYTIPFNLLQAIAQAESGKNSKGKMLSWPWTIQAQGQSYYCDSKEQAIKIVEKLQQQGIGNIDVGCMQINLKHHPHAFETLSQAFEPAINIAYAARYLRSLYDTYKSWSKAIAYYHSRKPYYYQTYLRKVNDINESLSRKNSKYPDQGLVRFTSYNAVTVKELYKVEESPSKNSLKPALKVRYYRRSLG